MMVPQYTLAKPVYCSGSDLAQRAFGVALVEQEVMVVVGQVLEEKYLKESCIGASTPNEMHSTEVATEHRVKMNERLVGHDIEM